MGNIGALIITLLQWSIRVSIRDTIRVLYSIGALIITIGFWGAHYIIAIIRNPQNGIGNYIGPYSI